jgi:hypothetical protein
VWAADLVGAVSVVALGAAVVVASRQLPYYAEYGPGPGFLPFWLGLALVACGLGLVADLLVRGPRHEGRFVQPGSWRAAVVLGSLVGTILLVPYLGLTLGLGVLSAFLMRVLGRHSWFGCVLVGVLVVAGTRWIFGVWLKLPLPEGPLGF